MDTDKKEIILETATKLYSNYGILHLTLDDVARDCGVSKKTIYKHFQNKSDLIHQIIDVQTVALKKVLGDITNNSNNAVIEFNNFFSCFHKVITSFSPTLIKDFRRFDVQILIKFSQINKTVLLPFIKKNLKRGKIEKLYKKELNINEFSDVTLTMIAALLHEDIVVTLKDPNNMLDFLKTLLLYRLVTVGGLQYLNKDC